MLAEDPADGFRPVRPLRSQPGSGSGSEAGVPVPVLQVVWVGFLPPGEGLRHRLNVTALRRRPAAAPLASAAGSPSDHCGQVAGGWPVILGDSRAAEGTRGGSAHGG